jgi:hypothetical protein
VQLRCGYFEDVAVLDRRHAVHRFRRDVHALARAHLAPHQRLAFLNLEQQQAGLQVDRLVLQVVVLQAQRMAGVHVNELADVPVGLRPVQLVSPRLLDARHFSAHYVTPWSD